ncbi:MAG: hypothetical protein VX424_06220 [Actinomycetota bacterium]|nr:hypothetical protein [Actinomycetota bacterium]
MPKDTTETADGTADDHQAEEPSAEAWQTLAEATANDQLADAFRTPADTAEDVADEGDEEAAASGGDDGGNPNREAARWRTKLRDTEAERDVLATQLEAMQRAAVDSHVTAMGMKPAALWAAGANLEDLLDENGVPDLKKVEAAAATARETLGVLTFKSPPARLQSGAMASTPKRDGWVEAFAPRGD